MLNRILSYTRRCVEDYDMIQAGDRIAVGVSGGKDSLALLVALAKLSEFYPLPFTVEAFTLDMGPVDGGPRMDFTPVAELCQSLGVPYTILHSEIQHIIFDLRKEKNPCSMCAKMRRGALHSALQERGLNKIALGHHYDDAVETFFMSLIFEGRLSCFQPVTWLDRTQITQIRPLLYCGENLIRHTMACGAQPLSRQRQHQAAGDQGADLRAQRPLPGTEGPDLWGHAAAAPAGVGAGGAPPPPPARGPGGYFGGLTKESSKMLWKPGEPGAIMGAKA